MRLSMKGLFRGALIALALASSGCGGGGGSDASASPAHDSTTTTASANTTTTQPGATTTATSTTTTVAPAVPAAPTLSLMQQTIKVFRFTWADVASETQYRLREQTDTGTGYADVATIPANATNYEHTVFLPRRINASYILQACNAVGCTDSAPVAVSGTLAAAVGYVKASTANTGDEFGYSVALSGDGNTLAVGAYGDDNLATDSGAVYVFARNGNAWSQQAYLKASNPDGFDQFGYSVALSADGNTLAVGAWKEDSNGRNINNSGEANNNASSESGAAYVFSRSGGTWGQQAYVKASNSNAGDSFGVSLALSGDGSTLAVGAYGEDSVASESGAVYVFTRSGTIWSQQAYLKASNAGMDDAFGASVALAADGNTLAVGAYKEGEESGAVYVFTRSAGTWSMPAYLKASNGSPFDWFGTSVALSGNGNTLAVGAYGEDGVASESGAVYVFTRSDTIWSQQAYLKASNAGSDNGRDFSDSFGISVALGADGNTLAVGAAWEDGSATGIDNSNGSQTDNSTLDSGAVYVFSRSGGIWSQRAYVKASNTGSNDWFGMSVSLAADGNTLAVGADREGSGAVYLY